MSENIIFSTAANLLQLEKIKNDSLKDNNQEEFSQLNNESYGSIDSKIMQEIKDFPLKVKLQPQFKNKIILHEILKKRSQYIDIFCCFIDIASIIIFYLDHLNYIENDFELTKTSYLVRSILLGISGIICFLLILSFKYKLHRDKIHLKIGSHREKGKILMKIVVEIYKPFLQLIIECIVHLLQPYPGVRYEWKVIYLGFEIMFNLNMLFFFFCSLRIYIIVKAIRYWNLFSQNTSIHMLRLFNELSNPYFFFYKSNLKRNGLITLFLLGAFSLIYFSLIFQVLEYFKKDISNEYYYFVNCIWYLIVTMCTVGYGDYTPNTPIGRVVAIVCCLIGIFILSVLVLTLSLSVNFSEDEQMAYNEIVSLGDTQAKKEKMENYMTEYIVCKYKYIRKRVDVNTILKRRKVDFEKKQIFIDLKKKYTNKYNLNEFKKNCLKSLDEKRNYLAEKLELLGEIEDDSYELIDDQISILDSSKMNLLMMNGIVNLAKCVNSIGSIKRLKNINEIQTKRIIDDEVFNDKMLKLLQTKNQFINK